ncbi:MAG: hypothetical protein IIW36_00785 [Clostridia bacterium]|nr:hypothetical protein [Clostridia bacterium]MBQ5833320.1 hypothetical protein [Clostridia bacterium]
MLEVLPIQSKQEQEALCARCGIPFQTELLAYQALVDGELRGMCQFTMDANGGRILHFASLPDKYEFEPMFVMGRAALNFIDLCGVHRAFFDAPCDNETLIRAIGFSKNMGGRYEVDLTDFFNEPCQHSK